MVVAQVDRSVALAWRLRQQRLDPLVDGTVVEVVDRLIAVPAMSDELADLSVRLRMHTSAPDDLARARADGRVIKTFAFRGATALMTPAQAADHLTIRAAGRQWELKSWREFYRLEPEDWPPLRALVREVLADGPLTPDALRAEITRTKRYAHLGPAFTDSKAWTFLKPFAWQGDMCFGPVVDGHTTFASLANNPHWTGVAMLDEAGPRAIETYLRRFGPATTDNVHHWLVDGLSAGRKRVETWFDGLHDRLAEVDVSGRRAYVMADDLATLQATEPTDVVRLLPGHDPWVMGPGTKDTDIVPPKLRDLVTRKANLVLAGGVVSGTWAVKGDDLVVDWLHGTPPSATALDVEAERLAGITGRPVTLRLR